jgi:thioredoxin 1
MSFFENVPELTIEEFNGQDLKKPFTGYLIVYAPWCGYCQKLKPIIDKLGDKIGIVSIDGDSKKEISQIVKVGGFPSIHFYKDGIYAGEYSSDRSYESLYDYFQRNSSGGDIMPTPQPVKPNYLHLILKLLAIIVALYICYILYKKYKKL